MAEDVARAVPRPAQRRPRTTQRPRTSTPSLTSSTPTPITMKRSATEEVLGETLEELVVRPRTAAVVQSSAPASIFDRGWSPDWIADEEDSREESLPPRRCRTTPHTKRPGKSSPMPTVVSQSAGKRTKSRAGGGTRGRSRSRSRSRKGSRLAKRAAATAAEKGQEPLVGLPARAKSSPAPDGVRRARPSEAMDFMSGLYPPKKLDIEKLCAWLEERDEGPRRALALRGLLAAYAHKQDTVPPWTASRYLPSVWAAARSSKSSSEEMMLALRLIRVMATTGEPWLRALIDAGLYRELAAWMCAEAGERVELPQWAATPASSRPASEGKVEPASRLVTRDRHLAHASPAHVRECIFATCKKIMRCVQKYGGRRENHMGLHAVSLRCGSQVCLLACLERLGKDCTSDEFDFGRHEMVYEVVQAYGGPQRMRDDMKETMEHMRRVRVARQAVLAERAMAAALGLGQASSPAAGPSCAFKPLPAHLALCGEVMDAAQLGSETEARRVFDRLMASSARVEKREAFREKCREDHRRMQQAAKR